MILCSGNAPLSRLGNTVGSAGCLHTFVSFPLLPLGPARYQGQALNSSRQQGFRQRRLF